MSSNYPDLGVNAYNHKRRIIYLMLNFISNKTLDMVL